MKTRSGKNTGKRGPPKSNGKKRNLRAKAKRTQDLFDPRSFQDGSDYLLSSSEEDSLSEIPSTAVVNEAEDEVEDEVEDLEEESEKEVSSEESEEAAGKKFPFKSWIISSSEEENPEWNDSDDNIILPWSAASKGKWRDGEWKLNAEDEDEYWNTDKVQLVHLICQRLTQMFPDLDHGDLEVAVEKALKHGDDLASQYCTAVPKDVSWKIGLNSKEIQSLEPQLRHLRTVMKEENPTIPKILKSGLTFGEKKQALQLYDILQNLEPYTVVHLDLNRRLIEMIRKPNPVVDTNVKIIRQQLESTRPTVEKIASALISQADKVRALQLFDAMQHTIEYTEDWFCLYRRIQKILEVQMSSKEEVARIEQEESSLKAASFDFRIDLKRKIFDLDANPETKGRLYEMYSDMNSREPNDPRYSDLRDKILWALRLPYQKQIAPMIAQTPSEIQRYCQDVFSRLNAEIYGMQEAKERIVQAVNDQLYNPKARTSLLALKGKPGVGKTKLAKTIAGAIGRPFDKISLGGAIDSTIFKGSDNVWSGATPSLLLQILSRAKCSNAVILLDEIDKLGTSSKGLEVQHALLHILDPTQNAEVQDAFLNEFAHDLSNIWFICALNDEKNLDSALLDRLNVIEIPSYTANELVTIVQRHTFPLVLQNKGISSDELKMTEEAIREMLKVLGKEWEEGGMRPIERTVNDIVSKINLLRSLKGVPESSSSSSKKRNSKKRTSRKSPPKKSLTPVPSLPEIPLSFSLPDFKGLPYIITPSSIQKLLPQNKASTIPSYYL